MEYLTAEQIVHIHRAVAGDVPLVRPDGLHSEVGLQQQTVFGGDAYTTVFDKAAARILLEGNGVVVRATVEEVVELLTAELAVNRIGVPELAVFLRAHARIA